ncbi:hypothetical protein MMC26_003703 [Xylographa opegraphella]|nr:hypothetical protein [Xylographa opegraphella]
MLLTGSCTIPQIATYTTTGVGLLEYPWVGCSPESPECCPFVFSQNGPLTVCPTDYFTTSSMCCPSGWSLLSTQLIPSLTPCYTSPALPLIPPSATSSSSVTPYVISTQAFTLSYALAPPPSAELTTAAKVGIAVGGALGLIFVLAAIFFTSRYRAHRANERREATFIRTETGLVAPPSSHRTPVSLMNKRATFISGASPHSPVAAQGSPTAGQPIPELPSPPPSSPPPSAYLGAGNGTRGPGSTSPPSMIGSPTISRVGSPGSLEPVMELPGSTYLHEHHPIHTPGDGAGG